MCGCWRRPTATSAPRSRAGRFREDLWFRLNVVALHFPPLRERPGDIAALAAHFARRFAAANGLPPRAVSPAAEALLLAHPWPGNVRELENTLHRAVLLAEGGWIGPEAIELTPLPRPPPAAARAARPRPPAAGPAPPSALVGRRMEEVERDLIIETLTHCLGNRTRAAEILGISIRTLRNKLHEYRAQGAPVPVAPGTGVAAARVMARGDGPLADGSIALPGWLREVRIGGDVALALGVAAAARGAGGAAADVAAGCGAGAVRSPLSVLILMVALFLKRPLDFTAFPQILLLTTLLRLALNVATTRTILTHGHEGPHAAGQVVAAFGGFLMGGDVIVGLIVFAILLVVNFMVVTKGSGRIAEVAARFSLDAMPGKQMAIDADLSAGLIDEKEARRRRRELEEESAFHGAMDGAAEFVRGDAIAGLIITVINLIGGLAIGVLRHGLPIAEAATTFSHADRGRRTGQPDPGAAGLGRRRHRRDQGRRRRTRRPGDGPPARPGLEADGAGRPARRRSWR